MEVFVVLCEDPEAFDPCAGPEFVSVHRSLESAESQCTALNDGWDEIRCPDERADPYVVRRFKLED